MDTKGGWDFVLGVLICVIMMSAVKKFKLYLTQGCRPKRNVFIKTFSTQ